MMIFFLIVKSVEAIEIEEQEVQKSNYAIQIGAFKNASNIDKIIENLPEYEIYLEPYKNLHRVQVINIRPFALKESLAQIRKIYPNAFISKRPIANDTPTVESEQKTFTINNKIVEPSRNKIEKIVPYEEHLDSHTILKTRKSFL